MLLNCILLGQEKQKTNVKSTKESKKEGNKETKNKESKEKIKKVKKSEEKVSEEPKVQKLTVKRTSTDAWASTAKSGMNGSHAKDNTLDALFNEFGADHSESGDDEMEPATSVVSCREDGPVESAKSHPSKTRKVSNKAKANSSNIDSPQVNGVKKKDISRSV